MAILAKLEDVCDILDHKRIPVTASNRVPGPYPYYGANGVQDYVADYIFDDELVLLAEDGGNYGSKDRPIAYRVSGKCWVNNHAHVLKPKENLNVDYLCYSLMFYDVSNLVNGSTRQKLTQADMRGMVIPMRSMLEQVKIVSRLKTIDGLIGFHKEQLTKLDELVKSQFIGMFESHSYEVIKAGCFMSEMRNGLSPSTNGKEYGKVLTLSAFTQGDFNPSAWKDGFFEIVPPEEKRISTFDFYMCRGNGNINLVGTGVYAKRGFPDLIFPDTVIAAHVDKTKICLPYLYYAWKQPSVRKQIETNARTTNGTFKINQKVIANVEIILPPFALQEQFVDFVQQSDKSKNLVQCSINKLEMLKAALMQEYFGGNDG